jgi:hypothetical protein
MANLISNPQRTRLQILYGQYAARSFDVEKPRDARLAWATETLGRPVLSFSKLTGDEGKQLIDHLQAVLGLAETAPSRRRRISKRDAQKLGTEGRADQIHDETTMVDGSEPIFTKIRQSMTVLGWDESRLKAFLRSSRGPNNGRDTIRTLGEANKVHWALKNVVAYQEKTRKRGYAA